MLKGEKVEMDKKDLIKEHKNLVKILRKGTKHELLMEAAKQEKELNSYLKGEED